jgi:hypothetical protein
MGFNNNFNSSGGATVLTDLEVDGTTLVVDHINNRVGIGAASPTSTLELQSSSGDLALEIDNNASNSANLKIVSGAGNSRIDFEMDGNNHLTMKGQKVAIIGTNPTAVLDVTGDGKFSTDLTVGSDTTTGTLTVTDLVTDTSAGTFTAVDINFDKTGASTTNNTMVGINVDMDNTTATGGTNDMTGIKVTPTCTQASGSLSNFTIKGMEIIATGSTSPENSIVRALDLTSTGGDYSQGILINTDDANGWDMKIVSSADNADFCTISTTTHGATTIATTDDGAAIAHLTLAPDGDVIIGGTTPKLVIGDADAEDTMLVFDGNAADFRIGIDDGTDTLEIGKGSAHGTTPAIKIDSSVNVQVMHNAAVADGEYSGDLALFTAGENLTVGEVVYFKADDSRMWKAVATAAATSRCVAMCVADVTAGAMGPFLLKGFARFNSAFPTFTIGGPIYTPEAEVGTNVPESAAPDSDGDFVQIIGWAVSGDAVYFDPDSTVIEVA